MGNALECQESFEKNENPLSEKVRKKLIKDNACYVLITCGNPTDEGKMHVEMTYEGDSSLAAMLVETAQGYIQESLET
jgi:hypothetical protein